MAEDDLRLDQPPEASPAVRARLAELGLDWPVPLWDAIIAGEHARQTATDHEPSTAGGLKDWIARVGALRSGLASAGWRSVNNHQIALTVNPTHTLGVGVLLGDERTGTEPASKPGPRSRYPKGPRVLELVAQNTTLFSPAEAGRPDLLDEADYARLQIWFLVTHRVLAPRPPPAPPYALIHSELSLPRASEDVEVAFVENWLDRIPLPPSPFSLPSATAG